MALNGPKYMTVGTKRDLSTDITFQALREQKLQL